MYNLNSSHTLHALLLLPENPDIQNKISRNKEVEVVSVMRSIVTLPWEDAWYVMRVGTHTQEAVSEFHNSKKLITLEAQNWNK